MTAVELERSTKERMSGERDLLHIPQQQTREQLSWMRRLCELITSLCKAMYCSIFAPFFTDPQTGGTLKADVGILCAVWEGECISTQNMHFSNQLKTVWKDSVHGHANQHQLYPQLATRASKISGE